MTEAQVTCSLKPVCPRLRVVAVVLAAGTASRMGGQPKCLLKWEGQSLLERLIDALEASGVDETVLVLGHHADTLERSLKKSSVRLNQSPVQDRMNLHTVLNPEPVNGQNSSLHVGLAKAQTLNPDWLLVGLADQPLIDAADLKNLIAAVKHRPPHTQMLQPSVNGQPGNPVMMQAQVMHDLLNAARDIGAHNPSALPGGKTWRQEHPELFHQWITTNVHYRIDIDSPQDMVDFKAQFGIELVWDI